MNTATQLPAPPAVINIPPADLLRRSDLLQLIEKHINQRPGFDPMNYGDAAGYRAAARTATRQLHDARAMLAFVACRPAITEYAIRAALRGGGRMRLRDSGELEYCTGQYWPTEYRAGACRVLATIIWDYWRDGMPPRDENSMIHESGRAISAGDWLRRKARQTFGRPLASRWFS